MVNLVELFLSGTSLVDSLGGALSEDVATDETEVLGELADFRVGNEEGEENTEVCSGYGSAALRIGQV